MSINQEEKKGTYKNKSNTEEIMKKNILLILILPIIVTSCYTTYSVSLKDDYNKAYIGANRAKIKGIYGIPDRVVNDKDMGEILIYETFTNKTNSYASAGSYNQYEVSAYGNTTSYTDRKYVEFYFNQDRCYKVNTNKIKYEKKLDKFYTALCVTGSVLWAAITTILCVFCTG